MTHVFLPDALDALVRMAQWMASSNFPSRGYQSQRVSVSSSLLPDCRERSPSAPKSDPVVRS